MKILEDLIEFRGRNSSWVYDINYLGNFENIYVMDNHKMAMWCWLQKIKKDQKYNILHVDRHTDTLKSGMLVWNRRLDEIDELSTLTPDEFSKLKYINGTEKRNVFTWGNYLSIFLNRYQEQINELQMITNGEGDYPNFENMIKTNSLWDFVRDLKNIFEGKDEKWIINFDVDYFVTVLDEGYINVLSDEVLEYIFEYISELNRNNKIEVITISLSPECSGGWDNSIEIANRICSKFGVEIQGI